MEKVYYVLTKLGTSKPDKHYFETEESALEWRDNWARRYKYSKESIYAIGPLPTMKRDDMVITK